MTTAERHNFSLRSLFLLIAVTGILLGLLKPVKEGAEQAGFDGVTATICCGLGGFTMMLVAMVIGGAVSPGRPRFLLSAFVGLLMGSLLGPIIGITFHSLWHVERNLGGLWYLKEETSASTANTLRVLTFSQTMLGVCVGGASLLLVMAYLFRTVRKPKLTHEPAESDATL